MPDAKGLPGRQARVHGMECSVMMGLKFTDEAEVGPFLPPIHFLRRMCSPSLVRRNHALWRCVVDIWPEDGSGPLRVFRDLDEVLLSFPQGARAPRRGRCRRHAPVGPQFADVALHKLRVCAALSQQLEAAGALGVRDVRVLPCLARRGRAPRGGGAPHRTGGGGSAGHSIRAAAHRQSSLGGGPRPSDAQERSMFLNLAHGATAASCCHISPHDHL